MFTRDLDFLRLTSVNQKMRTLLDDEGVMSNVLFQVTNYSEEYCNRLFLKIRSIMCSRVNDHQVSLFPNVKKIVLYDCYITNDVFKCLDRLKDVTIGSRDKRLTVAMFDKFKNQNKLNNLVVIRCPGIETKDLYLVSNNVSHLKPKFMNHISAPDRKFLPRRNLQ